MTPAEEPTYELSEGGSTLRVYPRTDATMDDLLTIEINGPADSVRLTWGDVLELSDALRDVIGQGTFKEEALRAAEKRGAAKALRREAARGLEAAEKASERDSPFTPFAVHLMQGLAGELARRADVIESGEVTR